MLARALGHGRRPDVRARWVRTLRRLVALPTIASASHRHALERAAGLLRHELARIGMDRCLILHSGASEPPSVWGEWRQLPGRPMLLLYGHFDVQPPGGRSSWILPPFSGAVAGGRVHGRGTSDNKGPLVALLAGLENYLSTAGRLPINVRVWLDGEEEAGSPHLADLLDRCGHLLRADGLALSDDTRLTGGNRPTLVTGLRGLVDLGLRVAGPGRPLHSGTMGGEVLDPALVLVRLVSSLWDPDSRIAVPGFYRRVESPSRGERHLLASARPGQEALARAAAVDVVDLVGECGWEPGERSTLRPSLTVTSLRAGNGEGSAAAAVPTGAAARLNFRLVPNQRPAEITALVARHLRHMAPPRARYKLEVIAAAEPVSVPEDHPLVMAASRALRATWGVPGGARPQWRHHPRRRRAPAPLSDASGDVGLVAARRPHSFEQRVV